MEIPGRPLAPPFPKLGKLGRVAGRLPALGKDTLGRPPPGRETPGNVDGRDVGNEGCVDGLNPPLGRLTFGLEPLKRPPLGRLVVGRLTLGRLMLGRLTLGRGAARPAPRLVRWDVKPDAPPDGSLGLRRRRALRH